MFLFRVTLPEAAGTAQRSGRLSGQIVVDYRPDYDFSVQPVICVSGIMEETGMVSSKAETALADLLDPLREGRIMPGSDKGRELISEALQLDPDETVRLIRPIDPAALREGMRASAFSENRIMELLRSPTLDGGEVSDPFGGPTRYEPEGPFPDPADLMRRGPTPFGRG